MARIACRRKIMIIINAIINSNKHKKTVIVFRIHKEYFFLGCEQLLFIYFFFSSRRRHTRSTRDWSSGVCSSDLVHAEDRGADRAGAPAAPVPALALGDEAARAPGGARRHAPPRRARGRARPPQPARALAPGRRARRCQRSRWVMRP